MLWTKTITGLMLRIHHILNFVWVAFTAFLIWRFENRTCPYALLITTGVLRSIFLQKIELRSNLSSIILWFFLETHFSLYIILRLLLWNHIVTPDLEILFILGQLLLVLHFSVVYFLSNTNSDKSAAPYVYKDWLVRNSGFYLALFIIGSSMLSLVSHFLNIGRMGMPEPDLPYKIVNIVILLKSNVVPFITLLFVDLFYSEGKKRNLIIALVFFSFYAAIESYIRGSRGVFFTTGLMLILWRIFRAKISKRIILRMGFTLIIFSIMSLFIFTTIRNLRSGQIPITIENVMKNINFYNPFLNELSYNRIFGTGSEILKFNPYIKNKWLGLEWSLFSKHKGGGLGFHTYEVDKTPSDTVHNSGVNGLSDGYLLAGYPGLFFTMLLFSLIALMIDNNRVPFLKENIVGKSQALFLLIIIYFSGIGFWSLLLFRNPLFHLMWFALFCTQYWLMKKNVSHNNL